jgi:predicted lipoprotein with Yx(FWY)xxD motif
MTAVYIRSRVRRAACPPRPGRRLGATATALVVVVVVAVAGCGGHRRTPTPPVSVASASVGALGGLLTGPNGRTLYLYVPDTADQVSCLGNCPERWPPLLLSAHRKVVAAEGVAADLLGSIPEPGQPEVRQVTYNGWPLYGYVGDTGPGQAHGQGLLLDGGDWFAMTPDGHPAVLP